MPRLLVSAALLFALVGCESRIAPAMPGSGAAAEALPAQPDASASSAFWDVWGDGQAEITRYEASMERYGAPRSAEVVLIYVTEPVSRRTWIKDDDAEGDDRINVLKLNASEKFLTGLYPYSVMTSVFSPVDDYGSARFQPVKLTLTAQEWCGHVFHGVWPHAAGFRAALFSYFAGEGETSRNVDAPEGSLYEDALLIQLRELDGPFNGGADWRGSLVPSLWRQRKSHRPLEPVQATISRADTLRGDLPVTRFTLVAGGYTRTYDVEQAAPRRVLGWATSDGDTTAIAATERLPYWQLNSPADTTYRTTLGLDTRP